MRWPEALGGWARDARVGDPRLAPSRRPGLSGTSRKEMPMPHALRVLWALLRQPTPRAAQPMKFRLQLWALTALVLLLASLGGGALSDGDGGALSNGGAAAVLGIVGRRTRRQE